MTIETPKTARVPFVCTVCRKLLWDCPSNYCRKCLVPLCDAHCIHVGIVAYCSACAESLSAEIAARAKLLKGKP